MNDVLLCTAVGNRTEVCISPLSRIAVEEAGLDSLGNDYGYFIYEVDHSAPSAGISILAKVASWEAALRLADIYRAGRPPGSR